MAQYTKKLLGRLFIFLMVILGAVANWFWPLYAWIDDTSVYRFIWLGIFFLFLDIAIEMILQTLKQLRLVMEAVNYAKNIKKIADGFKVVPNFLLKNNLKADYVVVGSSGVWLVTVQVGGGKITFSGDDLVQDGKVMGGLLTEALSKSYTLAGLLKEKLSRDFTVTSVVAFSSPLADLELMPNIVRGVYVASGKNSIALIENTDVQLIDKNTIEEINKILKK